MSLSELQGRPWIIQTGHGNYQGGLLEFQPVLPPGAQEAVDIVLDTETWASGCHFENDDLIGFSPKAKRNFVMCRVPPDSQSETGLAQLVCFLTGPQQQQLRTLAVSALVGTAIGAAVGSASGLPMVFALTGLVAASLGSMLTSAGSDQRSSATFVAEEGQSGGEVPPSGGGSGEAKSPFRTSSESVNGLPST